MLRQRLLRLLLPEVFTLLTESTTRLAVIVPRQYISPHEICEVLVLGAWMSSESLDLIPSVAYRSGVIERAYLLKSLRLAGELILKSLTCAIGNASIKP